MADHLPDDHLFDRLVDGALSPQERSDLIASLDDSVQGWRRCALRFLEAQSWSAQFRSLLNEGPSTSQPAIRSAAIATIATTPHHRSAPIRAGRWLAIAAGLLLSFGLGRFLSPLRPVQEPSLLASDQEKNSTAANTSAEDSLVAERDSTRADRKERPLPPMEGESPLDDSLTLVVRGNEGKLVRVRLPLVDSQELGIPLVDAAAGQTTEPLRSHLQRQGWNLQTRRRYAPLFIEQSGNLTPMVMPVDDAFVTPVARQVY